MEWYLVVILGIGTTFAVLSILWAVLELFAVIFNKKPQSIKADQKAPAVEPTVASSDSDETELVAILAAAIAAYTAQPINSFRVVSFRQIESRK